MPTYEFLCSKCEKSFEIVSSISQFEQKQREGIQCPTCGSPEVKRQISSFQVKTAKKS
jgi:putative FmdB family regulatory protein